MRLCVAFASLLACWAACIAPCKSSTEAPGTPACEASGYCSLGRTKAYTGDIHGGRALRDASEARSFKKEIVLMCSSAGYLLAIKQATMNLERLGMEHVMVLGFTEKDCEVLSKELPSYGCVWDHFMLPMVGKDIYRVAKAVPLWHNRWRTMARQARLGYNVLSIDTDVVFYHDPYRFFKAPPFKKYVIINQPETLYSSSDYHHVNAANGGIIYVQNASPTGPAAWLLAEVSDRILRFLDDNFKELLKHNIRTSCDYMDQDCLNDVIHSVQAGNIIFHRPFTKCTLGGTRAEQEQKRKQWSQ
eukprot:gene30110-35086_t